MKKNYDGKYVSSEKHEVSYIAKKFTDKSGEYVPVQFIHFLMLLIKSNRSKVLRADLYDVLLTIGYKETL